MNSTRTSGQRWTWLLAALLWLLVWPGSARADVGLPMLVVVWPGLGILLVPIIALEAAYARRLFGGGWKVPLTVAGIANVVSTVGGVPLTWGVLLLAEIGILSTASNLVREPGPLLQTYGFFVSAPWFLPAEGEVHWQLPLAAAILCVPFYLASVYLELRVARAFLPEVLRQHARRWAWRANLLSYGPITATLLGCAAWLELVAG